MTLSFPLRSLLLTSMLISGTFVTLSAKALLETSVDGTSFHRPWFLVLAMFIAMMFSLVFWVLEKIYSSITATDSERVSNLNTKLLTVTDKATKQEDGVFLTYLAKCGFPALCDLAATGLMSTGLVYVSASIYATLRGLNIVTTAFFGFLMLSRKYSYVKLILGLGLVLVGLGVVGWAGAEISNIQPKSIPSVSSSPSADSLNIVANELKRTLKSHSDSESDKTVTQNLGGYNVSNDTIRALYGMLLIVLAQIIRGLQYAWMELIMTAVKRTSSSNLDTVQPVTISPLLLVGMQGLVGTCLMLFVLYPLNLLNGENLHETMSLIQANPGTNNLPILVFVYMLSIMMLNVLNATCTKYLTGVITALISAGLRTAVVWSAGILIFYIRYNTDTGAKTDMGIFNLFDGEQWYGYWSKVQLVGFGVYIIGMGFYMGAWTCCGLS